MTSLEATQQKICERYGYKIIKFNKETGEVKDFHGTIKDFDLKEKEIKAYKIKKLRNHDLREKYGSFLWCIFTNCTVYFPELDSATLARLIYSLTYMGYNNYLKIGRQTKIKKSDLKRKLKLPDDKFEDFFKKMIDENIYILDNEYIKISDSWFKRGETNLKKYFKLDKSVTRIYFNGIRELYEQCRLNQHNALGYIYKILPFVSIEYNIVCHNPEETDMDKLEPMTLPELCDLIGYDKSNANKLMKTMSAYQIDGKCMIKYVIDGTDHRNSKIYVNPKIYYSGNHGSEVKILGVL